MDNCVFVFHGGAGPGHGAGLPPFLPTLLGCGPGRFAPSHIGPAVAAVHGSGGCFPGAGGNCHRGSALAVVENSFSGLHTQRSA